MAIAGAASLILMAGVAVWLVRAPPRATVPATLAGQDLDTALQSGRPTVVEFGSNACVSCREMKVVLAQLRQAHPDRYAVLEVDLLKQQDMARRHRIQLMPTQVFFDARGRETGRHLGKLSLEEVVARLQQASELRP